jgi:Immunoglobulin I-set domain
LQPTDQSGITGQTLTFSAAASGLGLPTVQWQASVTGAAGSFVNLSARDFTSSTSNGQTQSTLSLAADSGYHYVRAVFTNTTGTATTNITTLTFFPPPTLVTDPISQTVIAGRTVTFRAAASGNPSPTVQWQVSTDGGNIYTIIPGATSTTYSFSGAAADNGYKYEAVFTNTGGSVTTTAATLTVDSAPVITLNPSEGIALPGQVATFTAAATAEPSATVQWQVSGNGGVTFTNIAGATSTTLHITASESLYGDQYRAVFTNSIGSVTTYQAVLSKYTVTANPMSLGDINDNGKSIYAYGATASGSGTLHGTFLLTINGVTSDAPSSLVGSLEVPAGQIGIYIPFYNASLSLNGVTVSSLFWSS